MMDKTDQEIEEFKKSLDEATSDLGVDEPETTDKAIQKQPDEPRSIRLVDTEATSVLNPQVYIQMKALARDFIASKAIPKCWESESQVLVGIQTGYEMGMKPMESVNSLYVINGAVNIWGKATTRRLREHGYTIQYKDETTDSCTAVVKKGKEVYKETYTFSEAKESGYVYQKNKYTGNEELKIGWKPGINRRLKLRYGVLALIIKTYIPEVLGSATGIVEVDEDFKEPKQIESTRAEDKVKKALAAKNNTIEEK